MVQNGEAKLDCDKDCDVFKANQERLASKEEENKKQEDLKAQQVSRYRSDFTQQAPVVQ